MSKYVVSFTNGGSRVIEGVKSHKYSGVQQRGGMGSGHLALILLDDSGEEIGHISCLPDSRLASAKLGREVK